MIASPICSSQSGDTYLNSYFACRGDLITLFRCRDLALNWNIDIAHELEDYLDVLEDITISFDEEDQNLNFAEGTDRYAISKRPAVLTNLCV